MKGPVPNGMRTRPGRLLAVTVVALAVIGVVVAAARVVYLDNLGTVLQQALDPSAVGRLEVMREFDGRYAAHRIATLVHVVLGSALLILGLLQFHRPFRTRNPRFHRWSGRALVLATLAVVPTGLFFGAVIPMGGWGEVVATGVFGTFCMVAVLRAFVAIRRRQVALHREWMIRGFAVILGISTIRIVAPVLDLILAPAGYETPLIFAISLWSGWSITLGAAEGWIRYSRRVVTVPTLP